ncbi:hypothetical protein CRE_07621 [Caenorhabditis remanei]|uniref:Uncharacterized protein n=1 Tax=Caenorhabditis remanei TaxID=31234 RepID=E3MP98_CAERE|nr:hypothetical protein CRE_07621 [Caenorhabditis remanei]
MTTGECPDENIVNYKNGVLLVIRMINQRPTSMSRQFAIVFFLLATTLNSLNSDSKTGENTERVLESVPEVQMEGFLQTKFLQQRELILKQIEYKTNYTQSLIRIHDAAYNRTKELIEPEHNETKTDIFNDTVTIFKLENEKLSKIKEKIAIKLEELKNLKKKLRDIRRNFIMLNLLAKLVRELANAPFPTRPAFKTEKPQENDDVEYTSIDQLTYDEVYGVYTDWMWEQKTVSENPDNKLERFIVKNANHIVSYFWNKYPASRKDFEVLVKVIQEEYGDDNLIMESKYTASSTPHSANLASVTDTSKKYMLYAIHEQHFGR